MKVLVKKTQIQAKIKQLARRISKDYLSKDLILVGVLKGSFIFLADLARAITVPLEVDFIQVASYGAKATSSGVIKLKKEIDLPIEGKDVLIVEDIIDSGYTVAYLLHFIKHKKPRSLAVCALLDKPARRKVRVKIAYKGFTVPDRFMIGYGLDHDEACRNLPYIGYLGK